MFMGDDNRVTSRTDEIPPRLKLPYEINDVTPEEDKLIKKSLIGYRKPFVKCGPNEYLMAAAFREAAEQIYNFEVRPDDIWVTTFPRSGTTWTQEIVWLLKNGLDFAAAKKKPLHERFPMLETTAHIPELAIKLIKINFMNLGSFHGLDEACRVPSWKSLADAPSPRLIKSHLPLSLLPPNLLNTAKVIYVARDPRDVAVSYYYLYKITTPPIFRLNFKDFWNAFSKDLLPWAPVVSHTYEAWKKRHHPNLHFVFYEDMLEDLPKEIDRISDFLGEELTPSERHDLANHVCFKNMKKNKSVNFRRQFVRKGKAGDWRSHFNEKMQLQAEEFLSERLKGLDLAYPTIEVQETTIL